MKTHKCIKVLFLITSFLLTSGYLLSVCQKKERRRNTLGVTDKLKEYKETVLGR